MADNADEHNTQASRKASEADKSALAAIMQFQKLIRIMKPACALLWLLR